MTEEQKQNIAGILASIALVITALGGIYATYLANRPDSGNGVSGNEHNNGYKRIPEKPIIVVMDSHVPDAVYNEETRKLHGSNTDDISEIIDNIYGTGIIRREATNPKWKRIESIENQNPALIIIHKSAFHDYNTTVRKDLDTLVNTLNSIAQSNPETRFLIYSRGFCKEDKEDLKKARKDISSLIDDRYPGLEEKLNYFGVCSEETWNDKAVRDGLKDKVKKILQLE